MDKKILIISIMTILVLLGALWVIAATSDEASVASMNTTGVTNWTGANGSSVVSGYFINNTINITLDLQNATGMGQELNITNISIVITPAYFGLGTLGTEDYNYSYSNDGGTTDLKGGADLFAIFPAATTNTINIYNKTAGVNVSGEIPIYIWFILGVNQSTAKGKEEKATITITVFNNNSIGYVAGQMEEGFNKTTVTIEEIGVDGLEPRVSDFNITQSGVIRASSLDQLNGSSSFTFSNASAITIDFVINESNTGLGSVMLLWNTSTGVDVTNYSVSRGGFNRNAFNSSNTDGNGTQVMTDSTSCTITNEAQKSCAYQVTLSAGNFSKVSDGEQITFTVFTNDSFNHTTYANNFNLTFDGLNPYAKASVTKDVTTYTGGKVTISCTVSDITSEASTSQIRLVKPGGAEIIKYDVQSYEFMNTDTGEAGEYSAYCSAADVSGRNAESPEETFKIYYRTGGGAAPSVSRVADVDVSTTDAPSGDIGGKQGESQTFTLDGTTTHRLTFLTVGTDTVTLQIESDPVELTLSVGESKEADLDADGANDIKVTLDSIDNGKASVTLINLAKEAEAEAAGEAGEAGEIAEEAAGISTWLIVLIIIVVVIVIYFVIKGRKGKKGEVKFSRQDLV